MSSRALRKLQKQKELQKLENDENGAQEEEGHTRQVTKPSPFALLGAQDDEDDEDISHGNGSDDEGDADDTAQGIKGPMSVSSDVGPDSEELDSQPARPSKRKKKKGKKKKNPASKQDRAVVDDIDAALAALATTDANGGSNAESKPIDAETQHVCELLSIDSQHLQVSNEMRRLFGRAAFDAEREEAADHAARRMQSGEEGGFGVAEAIKGRNAHGGPGISQVILKRNLFVKGREDWPKATANGMSMDVVKEHPGGIIEFCFKHNREYQSAQREFEACVLSMDPTLLVQLLFYHPYNISTLLQVSEISKHEKDYSTSGELLERALFSFGRAVHLNFTAAVAKGKARLDFRRPENREFFLASWRYVMNIGMRATWRTAYEWAKLLLSLSPEDDPYCIRFVLDQLALRAKQGDHFLSLVKSSFFASRWATLPNIAFSSALAQRSSSALIGAVETFPWVAARLLPALDVSKLPPAVWGKSAPEGDDHTALLCELYVTQALDLWKAPDAKEFLIDACKNASPERAGNKDQELTPITLDEARHVLLTDKPPLIALIPREITSRVNSASDPLPPSDTISSYTSDVASAARHRLSGLSTDIDQSLTSIPAAQLLAEDTRAFIEEIGVLQKFFELLEQESESVEDTTTGSFTPLISESTPADQSTSATPGSFPDDGAQTDEGNSQGQDRASTFDRLGAVLRQSGASVPELRARLNRYIELINALDARPEHTVRSPEGDYASIRNGSLECHLEGMEIVGELREGHRNGSRAANFSEVRRRAAEVNDAQDVD